MLREAVHGTCSTVHAWTKPKDCKSDPKHIVFKHFNAATSEHNYAVTKSPEKHKAKKKRKVSTCEPRKVGNGLL